MYKSSNRLTLNLDEITAWFKADRTPSLSKDNAVEFLHNMHPRTQFLKTLPFGTCLLDAGPTDGGLEAFRRWPSPPRTDIHIYAFSQRNASEFSAYDGYETGDWKSSAPSFSDVHFDAVISCNFIQHLSDVRPFVQWTAQRFKTGGRLYLEWPSPFSTLLPSRDELAAKGITVNISNFYDDATNKLIHDRSRVVGLLSNEDFFIEEQGYISLPFIEEEILAHLRQGLNDPYAVQIAYWSKTKWLQYIVAVRK